MSIKIYCDRCGKELATGVSQKEKVEDILLHSTTYQYEQELCSDCELFFIRQKRDRE